MGGQQICINRKKINFRKKKRIVKKAIKHQPYVNNNVSTTEKPISDKKARREEKKLQIKMQKKANKKEKRQAKMDVEDEE